MYIVKDSLKIIDYDNWWLNYYFAAHNDIKSNRKSSYSELLFCGKYCKTNQKDFFYQREGVKYGSTKGKGGIRLGATKNTH